jgi:hypothetical protein
MSGALLAVAGSEPDFAGSAAFSDPAVFPMSEDGGGDAGAPAWSAGADPGCVPAASGCSAGLSGGGDDGAGAPGWSVGAGSVCAKTLPTVAITMMLNITSRVRFMTHLLESEKNYLG